MTGETLAQYVNRAPADSLIVAQYAQLLIRLDSLLAESVQLLKSRDGFIEDLEQARRDLAATHREFKQVRADRVQLEALYATSRDETLSLRKQVHDLNNRLTAVTLERDAARHEIHLYEVHAQQAQVPDRG